MVVWSKVNTSSRHPAPSAASASVSQRVLFHEGFGLCQRRRKRLRRNDRGDGHPLSNDRDVETDVRDVVVCMQGVWTYGHTESMNSGS
jgi:hypothetical protein